MECRLSLQHSPGEIMPMHASPDGTPAEPDWSALESGNLSWSFSHNTSGGIQDILAEEFCEIIENNGKPKTKKKGKLESAFRKMFVAIDAYREAVEQSAIKLKGDIMNVADPIVQKLTQHIEHVVALFLEYVAISVDLFMHKTQIEEMKKRERHVADLLHKHAMGQA